MMIRILWKLVLNTAMVWALATYLSSYFLLSGGIPGILIVGVLMTILNILVRPLLNVLALPLKLFATILAIIIVNGIFVQLVYEIIRALDIPFVSLEIQGGLLGWSIVAIALGLGNWAMKVIMK
jgi:putative membrane protein